MSPYANHPGLRRTARLLGLASAGLGAACLGRPKELARFIGVDNAPDIVPTLTAIGARELVPVLPLLAGRAGWAWARVAGDAMDLTAMGVALTHRKRKREQRLRAATIAVGGLALIDLGTALAAGRARRSPSRPMRRAIDVSAATTVNKPAKEVYAYWRDLEHLPRFMAHVRRVKALDDRHSRWVASAPAGRRVRWDAEVVDDRPGKLLRWRSVSGADVANQGSVEFRAAPGERGTEVRVHLTYDQPGGRLGKAVSTLLGESPEQQVRDDLARFKQLLETGEVVRSEGTPEGALAGRLTGQRPAVPA